MKLGLHTSHFIYTRENVASYIYMYTYTHIYTYTRKVLLQSFCIKSSKVSDKCESALVINLNKPFIKNFEIAFYINYIALMSINDINKYHWPMIK